MLTFLYVLHFLVCFILIGVVLLQRGKGQDLGASLGGGGANTIFGSRGAGNFLTKITTGSAIIFMITSLSLSYLGYKASDAQLFDESEPFVPEGSTAPKADGGLEEIPAAAAGAADAGSESGGLVEIPSGETAAPADAAAGSTADSASAPGEAAGAAGDAAATEAAPSATAEPAPAASEAAPAPAEPSAPAEAGAESAPSAAAPAPATGDAPAEKAPEKAAGQP